jgi:GT2 family glycosyltransferase
MPPKLSLIVATKDRPADLRRLLESLEAQSVIPAEIIVVDGSASPVDRVVGEFQSLPIRYRKHWPPSAAAQRNAGVNACSSLSTLIGFVDDDTTFECDSIKNMLRFWEFAPDELLGAAFNIRNFPHRKSAGLKHSEMAEMLGLYSGKAGCVSKSGWQTVFGEMKEDEYVEWLPTTAVVFRRSVLDQDLFDEAFDTYSYLEDLDLSYTVSRRGKLIVVANAGFFHFPSPSGRITPRQFGRCEVRNRLHFVRKHKLSLFRCYVALAIRLGMSVSGCIIQRNASELRRAVGNIEAIFKLT